MAATACSLWPSCTSDAPCHLGQMRGLPSSPSSSSFVGAREFTRWHVRRIVFVSNLQSPNKKGFGVPPKKNVVVKKNVDEGGRLPEFPRGEEDIKQTQDQEEDDDVPEVITNRMLRRISLTVGVPLFVGVLFFPLFYYLKVVKKVDVPEWLPLLTSMVTFGTAGLGITYGVLSASWDPLKEGSVLGWKEAQLNWPVFWETLQRKEKKK